MLSLIVSWLLVLGSSVHGAAVPDAQARQYQSFSALLDGIIDQEVEPFLMFNQTVVNTMVDGLKGAYFFAGSLSDQGSALSSQNRAVLDKIKKIVQQKKKELNEAGTYTNKVDQDAIENELDKVIIEKFSAIANYVENKNEETKKKLQEVFGPEKSPLSRADYIIMNSPGLLSRLYARPPTKSPLDIAALRKITVNETLFVALCEGFREQYFVSVRVDMSWDVAGWDVVEYLTHVLHSGMTNPKFGDEMQKVIDKFTAGAKHLEEILKKESKDFYKEVLRSFRNVVLQVRKLNAADPSIDMEMEIFNRLAKICPEREFVVVGYGDDSNEDEVAVFPYDEDRMTTITEGRKYSMIFSSDNYKENAKKYRQIGVEARVQKFKDSYNDKNLKSSLEKYSSQVAGKEEILLLIKTRGLEHGRVHSDDDAFDGFIFRADEPSYCPDLHTCNETADQKDSDIYVYVLH